MSSLTYPLAVDFRNFLMADSNLQAAIGERIYPVVASPAQDPKLSCVVYGFSVPAPLSPVSSGGAGTFFETHLTIICFSQLYDEALGIASYIKNLIDCKTLMIGNTHVDYCKFIDSQADKDDDTKNFLVTAQFTLTHK